LLVDWFSEEIPLVLQNKTVSVFETTIRVLGGLLSAHLVASDASTVLDFHTFGRLTM
jgi:mannosidase alpha-like ER degradation enhancer 2